MIWLWLLSFPNYQIVLYMGITYKNKSFVVQILRCGQSQQSIVALVVRVRYSDVLMMSSDVNLISFQVWSTYPLSVKCTPTAWRLRSETVGLLTWGPVRCSPPAITLTCSWAMIIITGVFSPWTPHKLLNLAQRIHLTPIFRMISSIGFGVDPWR